MAKLHSSSKSQQLSTSKQSGVKRKLFTEGNQQTYSGQENLDFSDIENLSENSNISKKDSVLSDSYKKPS